MNNYQNKKNQLFKSIEKYTKADIIIAFSGGVDSSLLLKIACEAARKAQTKVYAVTVHTKLHPVADVDIARRVAKEAGAIHEIFQVDELQSAGILSNPVNRCYLCKKFIFTQLKDFAQKLNVTTIAEGTNEDDLHVYRPGIQALRELNIISPLADAGLTKAEIRKMAAEYGVTVAKRPSAPCLATRFPYHTKLSYSMMQQVERGEEFIKNLGFYNVRIRVHNDIARIEVDEKDMDRFVGHRIEIIRYLKDLNFDYITVDLQGFRSGSMDDKIVIT